MNNTDKQLFRAYEKPQLKELDSLFFQCAAWDSNLEHEDDHTGEPAEGED